jgi:hypothetical protein
VRLDLLTVNPTDRVDAPKARRASVRPFTPAEARMFLRAAQRERQESLYRVAIMTGLQLR